LLLKMAIEIVDLPIEHGDFPSFFCMFTRGYPQSAVNPGLACDR